MRQQLLVSATKHPWLLPALGLALFVHKHFLSCNGQHNSPARLRPGAKSRPPKLKRKQKQQEQAGPQDAAVDEEAERLDASGLAPDRLMEWFTEDEVEAMHQAQANPAALMSLLRGNHLADMEDDAGSSQWSTDDEDAQQALGSLTMQPLQLLQDSLQDTLQAGADSPVNAGSAAAWQQLQQLQQQQQEEQVDQQLVQELLLQVASARQQLAGQQQQQQPRQQSMPGYEQPATSMDNGSLSPAALKGAAATAAAAAAMQQPASTASDYDDYDYDYDEEEDDDFDAEADYWDPNHYYALSPAAAAAVGPPATSPGHFMPRAGALWASSYPPRFGEDIELAGEVDEDGQELTRAAADQASDADLARHADLAADAMAAEMAAELAAGMDMPFPDWEPDLDDWDLDAPEFDPGFDPGFDDGDAGFDRDYDKEMMGEAMAALFALTPGAVQPPAAVQA